jgi:hypothetical protein
MLISFFECDNPPWRKLLYAIVRCQNESVCKRSGPESFMRLTMHKLITSGSCCYHQLKSLNFPTSLLEPNDENIRKRIDTEGHAVA